MKTNHIMFALALAAAPLAAATAAAAATLESADSRVLNIPREADWADFLRLVDGKTHWRDIRCQSPALDDRWMEVIAAFDGLRSFYNWNKPQGLSPRGMALLGQLPDLRMLLMCSAQTMPPEALEAIASGSPNLEFFSLCDNGPGILRSEDLLQALAKWPHLKTFRLQDASLLTEDFVFAVGDLGLALQELSLPRMRFATEEGLARYLEINPRLGDASLALPAWMGDEALEAIARHCPEVWRIHITGARGFTDDGLAVLPDLPRLHTVYLMDADQITDAGFDHLGRMGSLHWLYLPKSPAITDEGLLKLRHHLYLSAFNAAAGITDRGVEKIARGNPRLEQLELSSATGITDASLDLLAGHTTLWRLDIESAEGVTAEGLARFRERNKTFLIAPRLSPPVPPPDELPALMEPALIF